MLEPRTFDLRVYSAVIQIPFGKMTTYGQIADLIGSYGCAREVGRSHRRLKLPSNIPCSPVVNAKRKIQGVLEGKGPTVFK